MTDKQIIIDGVDVKECAYFRYPLGCNSLDNKTCQCINNDCDYKEYKRKEQECEELKIYIESNEQQVKEVETLVMDNDRLINELNQLKQALSDIKNIVETCNSGVDCSECPYTKECRTDIEAEALGICKLISQKCEVLNEHN